MEDLNQGSERISAESSRPSTPRPSERSSLSISIGQYPSGWVWETDSDGRVLWCSPELRGLLGYHPDDLIGKNLITIAHSPQSTMELQRALASRQPIFNLKLEGITRGGRPVILLLNAILRRSDTPPHVGYRGVTHVLGSRDPSAQEMDIAFPVLEEVEGLPTSPEVISRWEFPSGYLIHDGEILPIETPELPEIPLQPEITDGCLKVPILGQQDTILGVVEFERTSNDPPWTDEDKELVSSISQQLALAIQDVRSYQLTQQALDEMRKVDQLKTEFLANMSHELRTPLNSIIGFSRVILKGIDGPVTETQKQDLTAIFNAGQHLLGLINNILDFSKIESGKMDLALSEVDLSEIITSVLDTAAGLIKGHPIKLIRRVPEVLPSVWGNSIRIRQVLLNLISNAVKFTEEGEIGISAKVRDVEANKEIILSVFDSGPGISPEDQKKIFQPFSQLDSSPTRVYSGTGLGLSICRHLVELHGGRIWVDSVLGEGSTFYFTLPIASEVLPEKPSIEAPLILAACTQQDKLDFKKELIETAGYAFHPLVDVKDIIPVAIETQPQVILIDPTMPDGLGWNLVLEVKKDPQVRTIPTKIFSLLDEFDQGIDLGIGDITTKPLLKESLESSAAFLLPDGEEEKITLIIDDDRDHLEWCRTLAQTIIPGVVRIASSGFEGLVATRQQLPDLVILNLFMGKADGFRMVEALRIDDRTKNTPVLLLLPQELSDAQIRQLLLWTKHFQEKAARSTQTLFERLFNQLSD